MEPDSELGIQSVEKESVLWSQSVELESILWSQSLYFGARVCTVEPESVLNL